jgi:hypothetical protein
LPLRQERDDAIELFGAVPIDGQQDDRAYLCSPAVAPRAHMGRRRLELVELKEPKSRLDSDAARAKGISKRKAERRGHGLNFSWLAWPNYAIPCRFSYSVRAVNHSVRSERQAIEPDSRSHPLT